MARTVAAGILSFVATLLLCLAITVLVIQASWPDVPNATEAYETFGYAMMALYCFVIGAILSLCVAVIVAVNVGAWVGSKK